MGRDEQIRRAMQAKADATVRNMITGGTSTNAVPDEPLTIDKIGRMAADMRAKFGPTPMFLSSKLFPDDKVLVVENATTRFTCAGRGFWARFQDEVSKNQVYQSPSLGNSFSPMFGIQIHEIDVDEETSPERWLYLGRIWSELVEAVKVAMTPLPDWIWNAPKFDEHG